MLNTIKDIKTMINSKYNQNNRASEKGNVLFLILIAVALFAALSYAVTSSSRSGGGDASDETNLISSAQITQYPASVRTSIVRMIISKGITPDELEFNPPSDFASCTVSNANCVFHPAGGGATFVQAPADVVTGTTPQSWVINGENEIYLIGQSGSANNTFTAAQADVIAFLPNVKTSICQKINTELGINGGVIPAETGIDVTTLMDDSVVGGFCDGGCNGTIGRDEASLDGQAFGCFSQGGANYYYHVLIEQ